MRKNRDTEHEKRMRKMILLCGLCAIILSVSTYAWFIGMKTVNVSTFNVDISSVESLYLSLDGKNWANTVTINESNYMAPRNDGGTSSVFTSAQNNTNAWGQLIPLSTVGNIDGEASTLIMYEKGSLTATKGGYRLMASRVKNYYEEGEAKPTVPGTDKFKSHAEANGYVAFDLFIKNMSGEAYYEQLQPGVEGNEEAIYLTPESDVTVSSVGGIAGTGIENSVRVAFTQVGRVKASTSDGLEGSDDGAHIVQNISCGGNGSAGETYSVTMGGASATVTGICAKQATIWEPNDAKHVQNALNWYDTSCSKRNLNTNIGTANEDFSYQTGSSGKCKTIGLTDSVHTYAIADEIDWRDYVDVYDGADYNGYTADVADKLEDIGGNKKLLSVETFKDSDKLRFGVNRKSFMMLAPNSITKVRVYVWIEGQDIDNYDFASLGKKISVAFGFTKERFYGSDVGYVNENQPELPNDNTGVDGYETYFNTPSVTQSN